MGGYGEWVKVRIPSIWVQIDKTYGIASGIHEQIHEQIAEIHTETFKETLPGSINLVADEKVLIKFWLAAGHWRVSVFAKLRGLTASSAAWTNAQMTVSAKPSDFYPQQTSWQAAQGNSDSPPLPCTLHARSTQTMFVTVSASDWGPYPGVLEEFSVVASVEA